jgi:hypothetical protein
MDEPALKTGAVVCKKRVNETEFFEYEALVFVTDIPHGLTDNDLKAALDQKKQEWSLQGCNEVLYRADINSTSNEVWEQYKGLNNDNGKAQTISFHQLISTEHIK